MSGGQTDEVPTRRHRADALWPGPMPDELLDALAGPIAAGTAAACDRLGLAVDRAVLVVEGGWPYVGWLPVTADADDSSMVRFLRGHWSTELRERNKRAEVTIGDRLFFDWLDDADAAAAAGETPADVGDGFGRWAELMVYALVAAGDAIGRAGDVGVAVDELADAVVLDGMPKSLEIPVLGRRTSLIDDQPVEHRATVETVVDDMARVAGFVTRTTDRLVRRTLAAAGVRLPAPPVGVDAPPRQVGTSEELSPEDLLPGVASMQRSLSAGISAFGFGRPVRLAYGGRTVRGRAVRAATLVAARERAGDAAGSSIAVVDAAGLCDPADLVAFAAVACRTGAPFDALQLAARVHGVPVLSGAGSDIDAVPDGATVELSF